MQMSFQEGLVANARSAKERKVRRQGGVQLTREKNHSTVHDCKKLSYAGLWRAPPAKEPEGATEEEPEENPEEKPEEGEANNETTSSTPMQNKPTWPGVWSVAKLRELQQRDEDTRIMVQWKWTEAKAIPNQEAASLAKVLVESFVCRFGIPGELHSDQGRQFEASLFQEVCKLLTVLKTRTTPYPPQSDGMVERFNRTLESMLAAVTYSDQRDWDSWLPYLNMAYNSAVHETTGFSPAEIMFGFQMKTPLECIWSSPADRTEDAATYPEFVESLKEKLNKISELARCHLKSSGERQKEFADRNSSIETFKPGDLVWVYQPAVGKGRSPKLHCPWKIPFLIVNRINDILYRVQFGPKPKPKVLYFNRIRRYEGTARPAWVQRFEPKEQNRGEGVKVEGQGEYFEGAKPDTVESTSIDSHPREQSKNTNQKDRNVDRDDGVQGTIRSEGQVSPEFCGLEMSQSRRSQSPYRKREVRSEDRGARAEGTARSLFTTEYRCRDCGLRFVDKGALMRHAEEKHQARLLECTQCPYRSNRKGDLQRHENKLHRPTTSKREGLSKQKKSIEPTENPTSPKRRKIESKVKKGGQKEEAEDDVLSTRAPSPAPWSPVSNDEEVKTVEEEVRRAEQDQGDHVQKSISYHSYAIGVGWTMKRVIKTLRYPDRRILEIDSREL
ncbi:hypothetical protein HOLleu_04370 [Holothuria leucospilota]|uniref:Integrase catalytic domain-containing protein n=1 Tax=Holothuria leucospilota TaxID=206669 RepID=A0A9Q1CTS4_HOLLE|nr:hypothetical protein HOLleu_04370 [Holothuria leucospilota]